MIVNNLIEIKRSELGKHFNFLKIYKLYKKINQLNQDLETCKVVGFSFGEASHSHRYFTFINGYVTIILSIRNINNEMSYDYISAIDKSKNLFLFKSLFEKDKYKNRLWFCIMLNNQIDYHGDINNFIGLNELNKLDIKLKDLFKLINKTVIN